MTSDLVAPLDPLAPTVAGRYEDPLVSVGIWSPGETRSGAVRTEHFELASCRGRVRLRHRVPTDAVDDDLAGLLQRELFGPGWLRGAEVFERLFTGVVRTVASDPLVSWERFYRNTLRGLESASGSGGDHGSIAQCAPVHRHARALLTPGSVLELGCCFGFLSLQVAAERRTTTASDVSPGTVGLLAAVAPRLGVDLCAVTADAARYPGPDASADTVLVIHLLEHLEPAHGTAVVAEALRLAARRVVVSVPLADEADETFGHVRTVSLDDLRQWGRHTELAVDVHEHHGGWLVLDRA